MVYPPLKVNYQLEPNNHGPVLQWFVFEPLGLGCFWYDNLHGLNMYLTADKPKMVQI